MAKFPALPLFTDAFIADTMHLNASQTGAYLMLLMVAWRTPDGKLENDDIKLSRYARMDKRTWKANKDVILSFWKTDSQGMLYQARLQDERKNVEQLRSKNVEAGRASALKRLNRDSTSVATKVQQKSSTPPNPTHISNNTSEKGVKFAFEGHVIRLTMKDWDNWEVKFFNSNYEKMYKYMDSRDNWLAEQSVKIQKNWFMSTKSDLEKNYA